MIRAIFKCIIGLILTLSFMRCQFQTKQAPGTKAMVEYLASKADSARQATSYPYFTDKMLRRLQVSLKGLPPSMKAGKLLDYALVLILKGDNETCIREIETYLTQTANNKEVNPRNDRFYKVLALAHLRRAEQDNCIHHHSSRSCIVPLSKDGIHQQQEPAETAKKYYEQLLRYDSTDYQSRWFYNLTHMATGTYPQAVNADFLIPPKAFESDLDFPEFKNVANACGVATRNHAGGSSLADFNNDGLLDVFTSSYSLADPAHLYLNNGKGGFDDFTKEAGIANLTGGLNHVHADFNNDGWIDIFIARGAWLSNYGHLPNSLLINTGKGHFEDRTEAAGLLSYKPTGAVAVADIDLDGDLDIFVGNESTRDRNASELYLNQGNGHFEEVAKAWDLQLFTYVKAAVWGDINNDQLPDLFLSNYGQKNILFVNRIDSQTQRQYFEEITVTSNVTEPRYSFTSWFWDYNQDGWQDLLVFGYDNRQAPLISATITKELLNLPTKGEYPRLFLNQQTEKFQDVTAQTGLKKLLYTMGGNFGDLDNDGYPDFYAGTGEFNIWATIPNKMYRNAEGQFFQDVTTAGGFGQIQKGHGVAFGDIDNDGDQDIYHQVGGAVESDVFHNMLFENPGFKNHWIKLRLQGTTANRSAIGAKIEIQTLEQGDTTRHYHWVNTGGSFGANSLIAEIGLGKATAIDYVKIYWPNKNKTTQVFSNLGLDQSYEIVEGKATANVLELPLIQLHQNPE
ncbi:MAG: CRTAC1 family protein [Saprospiraceae bacterium]